MNRSKSLVVALAVLVVVGIAAAQGAKNITVKGSDTMVILGQKWAEVFMQKNSGISVQVTGGGSGTGIAALTNGTTDIAESSRPMRDTEKDTTKTRRGKDVVELPVAVDGVAFYVHESNSIAELSLEQLKGIYMGVIKNWKDVGGADDRIILYSRENNSGTYAFVKEHVLQNGDFFPTAQTLPGTAAVINAVAKDRRGIGYGGVAYGKGVKFLKVKKDANSPAVEPSMENVLSAKYPVSRYLYWYFAGMPQGDVKKLADWVVSEEGQKVVENVGYYPLNATDRAASAMKLGGSSAKGKSKAGK